MIPYNLVCGGVAGISIILAQFIHSEIFTVDFMVTALSWMIFFLGLIFLGKSFSMKTLLSTIVYPPCVSLFMRLSDPDVLGGYFYLQGNDNPELALLLAPFVGGALVGAGCALTFLGGGSTGGTDILAFIACKIFPRLKSSVAVFIVDTSVVILGVFAIGNIVVSLLGVVSTFVCAFVIDKVFLGGQKTFIAQIISDKHEEIREKILTDLNRGATIIDVTGAYSGEARKMIMVSFTMRQYNQVLSIINKTDKSAFVTVHRAHEINGVGFTIPRGDDKKGRETKNV
jgi:uncharacterized membrane-anchored protein YitT (DUF2179 family)